MLLLGCAYFKADLMVDMHSKVLLPAKNDHGFPPFLPPQTQNKSLVGNQIVLFPACVSCSLLPIITSKFLPKCSPSSFTKILRNAAVGYTASQILRFLPLLHCQSFLSSPYHFQFLIICNTYCFSATLMVAQTRLNLTLYVHCMSC
jgi:hypothetical protein